MMLQPSNFNYNTNQNARRGNFANSSSLAYGDKGLTLLSPYRISAKNIFRLRLFLNRAVNNSARTKRTFWLLAFPHLPLSRNPNGVRMGNGAGNLASWYTQVRGGVTLVEFNNLRFGRARFFVNQLSHKFPVPVAEIGFESRTVKLTGGNNVNSPMSNFY